MPTRRTVLREKPTCSVGYPSNLTSFISSQSARSRKCPPQVTRVRSVAVDSSDVPICLGTKPPTGAHRGTPVNSAASRLFAAMWLDDTLSLAGPGTTTTLYAHQRGEEDERLATIVLATSFRAIRRSLANDVPLPAAIAPPFALTKIPIVRKVISSGALLRNQTA